MARLIRNKRIGQLFSLFFFFPISIVMGQTQPEKLEPYRPAIHFTPKAHWMNDPNGLVYYGGNYHLFYQYYPDGTVWGPMHWGHAVSKDLLQWEHLPIALYPDSLGYIFSGSVVVDHMNTAGLQQGKEKTLIAIFTYHDPKGEKAGTSTFQTQGMAYSNDGGFTWKKYTNNPVLNNPGKKDFRDPKVSWYAKEKKWIMTLAVGNHVEFYSSSNLKAWTFLSSFGEKEGSHGGVWECPDLIKMKDASSGKEAWVLLVSIGNGGPNGGSATQYFTGQFDGKQFINDEAADVIKWVDQGTDNYAGVTYFDAPGKNPIFIGWMSNWQYAQQVPTNPWRSAMTIPRELTLKETTNGLQLISQPIEQLTSLLALGSSMQVKDTISLSDAAYTIQLDADLVSTDVNENIQLLEWNNQWGDTLSLQFNPAKAEIILNRLQSGPSAFNPSFNRFIRGKRIQANGRLTLQLIVDRSSIEIFADNGSLVLTALFFPSKPYQRVRVTSNSSKIKAISAKFTAIKPILQSAN
jgi:fructan beta-fructosidase